MVSSIDSTCIGVVIKHRKMNKNFLIIDCTGKNDCIALFIDNKFFIKKLQTILTKYEVLVVEVLKFIKKYNVKLDNKFSVIVNTGPGSFSGIRIALATAKGINLTKSVNIFSYNNFLINASLHLNKKKKIISIQKTFKNFYYMEILYDKKFTYLNPKLLNNSRIQFENSLIVAPLEIRNDGDFLNFKIIEINYVENNLKNISLLIDNNLLENKLIKPLYLS